MDELVVSLSFLLCFFVPSWLRGCTLCARHRRHDNGQRLLLETETCTITKMRRSKRPPQTELERVGLVFVAREDPRQAIGRLDFEQHDLIVDDGPEASGERQIYAIRDPLSDREPCRRVQARRLLAVRIDERRRQLKRVDAEGLLHHLADLGGQGARYRLRGARRQT